MYLVIISYSCCHTGNGVLKTFYSLLDDDDDDDDEVTGQF